MDVLGAALALGLERACYAWVSRRPEQLRALCARWPRGVFADPVVAVTTLFVCFKTIQAAVFIAWCAPDFRLWALRAGQPALLLGAVLIGVGQGLNVGVFRRLGTTGVFYGAAFGHVVPWQHGFPFSVLRHPQYVGTVMSIWGLFLLARAPAPDWYVLPVIETLYYAISARVEG